jgi:hypothetical protein
VNVLKFDFSDVDEATFHFVERTLKRIFYIPGIQKTVLDEVDEVMFQVG